MRQTWIFEMLTNLRIIDVNVDIVFLKIAWLDKSRIIFHARQMQHPYKTPVEPNKNLVLKALYSTSLPWF